MNFGVISKTVLAARKKIVYMLEHIEKEERHPKSEKFYATNGFKKYRRSSLEKRNPLCVETDFSCCS